MELKRQIRALCTFAVNILANLNEPCCYSQSIAECVCVRIKSLLAEREVNAKIQIGEAHSST